MTLFRCFALLCALCAFSALAEEEFDEANLMDEAAVMREIAINQRTVKKWTLEGHLKPVAVGDKIYYTKSNVAAVKKSFGESEKARLEKANEQLANDSRGGGSEISRKQQLELREKEKRERGAGASSEERAGVENQVDYRKAELDARKREAEAIKNNRGNTGGVDDRKAERDAAQRAREAEKNAKRL